MSCSTISLACVPTAALRTFLSYDYVHRSSKRSAILDAVQVGLLSGAVNKHVFSNWVQQEILFDISVSDISDFSGIDFILVTILLAWAAKLILFPSAWQFLLYAVIQVSHQ